MTPLLKPFSLFILHCWQSMRAALFCRALLFSLLLHGFLLAFLSLPADESPEQGVPGMLQVHLQAGSGSLPLPGELLFPLPDDPFALRGLLPPLGAGLPAYSVPEFGAIETPLLTVNASPSTIYRRAAELDLPPALITAPPFDQESAAAGLPNGAYQVRIYLGASGQVDRVELLSSGLEQNQELAILALAGQARFKPGEVGGKPVPTQLSYELVIDAGRGDSYKAGRQP